MVQDFSNVKVLDTFMAYLGGTVFKTKAAQQIANMLHVVLKNYKEGNFNLGENEVILLGLPSVDSHNNLVNLANSHHISPLLHQRKLPKSPPPSIATTSHNESPLPSVSLPFKPLLGIIYYITSPFLLYIT